MKNGKSMPNRNVSRIISIINILGNGPADGMRSSDVARATRLNRATAHRLLVGLVSAGMLDYNDRQGLFVVGVEVLRWASAALDRYGIFSSSLRHVNGLSALTGDSVALFFQNRRKNEFYCCAVADGTFPIKVKLYALGKKLTFGLDPISIALLGEPDTEIIDAIYDEKSREDAHRLSKRAIEDGYSYSEGAVLPGISHVAVPIVLNADIPPAALAISAISTRLAPDRLPNLVLGLNSTKAQIESEYFRFN